MKFILVLIIICFSFGLFSQQPQGGRSISGPQGVDYEKCSDYLNKIIGAGEYAGHLQIVRNGSLRHSSHVNFNIDERTNDVSMTIGSTGKRLKRYATFLVNGGMNLEIQRGRKSNIERVTFKTGRTLLLDESLVKQSISWAKDSTYTFKDSTYTFNVVNGQCVPDKVFRGRSDRGSLVSDAGLCREIYKFQNSPNYQRHLRSCENCQSFRASALGILRKYSDQRWFESNQFYKDLNKLSRKKKGNDRKKIDNLAISNVVLADCESAGLFPFLQDETLWNDVSSSGESPSREGDTL